MSLTANTAIHGACPFSFATAGRARARWPNYLARPFATFRMPVRYGRVLLKLLQPCDAEALRDSTAFEACFESQRRAWRGSVEGVMADAQIYAQPWGFALEEVDVPVRLWHGK